MGYGKLGQTVASLHKLVMLAVSSTVALAGPPMLTDDPFVPNVGQFEVNFSAAMQESDHRVITAPIVDLNYGVMENVELTAAMGYIVSDERNDWDALELAFKWMFYGGDFFSIALSPKYLNYPVKTIFNEGQILEVNFPMNFQFSETWSLVLSPNYVYRTSEEQHPELGTYLQYSGGNHNFYVEFFMEESKDYDATFMLVNFGYLWQFHDNVAFMLSLGRELKAEEQEATIAYSGLQLLF